MSKFNTLATAAKNITITTDGGYRRRAVTHTDLGRSPVEVVPDMNKELLKRADARRQKEALELKKLQKAAWETELGELQNSFVASATNCSNSALARAEYLKLRLKEM